MARQFIAETRGGLEMVVAPMYGRTYDLVRTKICYIDTQILLTMVLYCVRELELRY